MPVHCIVSFLLMQMCTTIIFYTAENNKFQRELTIDSCLIKLRFGDWGMYGEQNTESSSTSWTPPAPAPSSTVT